MRYPVRRSVIASLSFGLLCLALLALSGIVLRSRVLHAVAATATLQTALTHGDIRAGCRDAAQAAAAWDSTAALSRPLAPLLHHLGWVPQVGNDLRVLPEAVALAQHGSAVGTLACTIAGPALQATTGPQRITVAAQAVRDHADALATMRTHVEQAQAAWRALAPLIDASPRLAPHRAQLQRIGDQLPMAIDALTSIEHVAPQLPWLLGDDAPRRLLLVVQNPFELRPTGGFIGLICLIRIDHAQPSIERCQPSESYATPAPTTQRIPFPYTRYLRLGGYYLRDANWSPDFPTTARTIQEFWKLNDQPAVDGVIAVDPYALVPLVEATGPLILGDGSQIDSAHSVEALLARYYDGAVFRNKSQLAALLPAVIERVQQADGPALANVARALQTSLNERHLLVAINQPDIAAELAVQGWDGRVARPSGDALRIVDADVGYGAVNAFVERLTHYDVALDDAGRPLTATLTLTYTNSYSPWAEAPTPYAVNGQCTDPQTLTLEQRPGCYANYLRVYVPAGSRLIDTRGLEESLGVDRQHDRTVFGGYLRINPGEQRVVRFAYRLPALASPDLLLEKQPGTLAPPILITAHTAQQQAALWTSGRSDRVVQYRLEQQRVRIDGPEDTSSATMFARAAAYNRGLQQWNGGDHAGALATWQVHALLDRALDHARALAASGARTEALDLIELIAAVAPDGRALFEQATLLEAQGDQTAADRLFDQAAERSPDQPLAQLTLARRAALRGAPLPNLQQLSPTSSAVRRWRAAMITAEQLDHLPDMLTYEAVLHQITPADRALALRYADHLLRAAQRDAAQQGYAALASRDDIWGRLARARQAQLAGDRMAATAAYVAALPLATTYETAFSIGDGLRDLGAIEHALEAYDRAAAFPPGSIWPLLAAGNMLRSSDPAAAHAWYARAQQLDPRSGYPDYARGTLFNEQGDHAAARPLLQAAVAKQPDVQPFQAAVTQTQPPKQADHTQ